MRRATRLSRLVLRLLLALALVLGPALGRHGTAMARASGAASDARAEMMHGEAGAAHAVPHAHPPHPAMADAEAPPHHPVPAHPPAAERVAPAASLPTHPAHAAGDCDRQGPAKPHGMPECCGAGSCWMACHLLALTPPPVLPAPAGSRRAIARDVPDPSAVSLDVAKPPPRAFA